MLNFDQIPIVDHHAHPFLRRSATDQPLGFQRWFTESTDATVQREHVPHTLVYRTAIRWLAAFLGCEPTVDAILAARSQIGEADYTARLFADANIATVLCDYGYGGAEAYDHAAMQALLPCPVHRVLRLERLAAFVLGGLLGEVLDRVHAADQHVAQRLAGGFGVVELVDRRLHRMLG